MVTPGRIWPIARLAEIGGNTTYCVPVEADLVPANWLRYDFPLLSKPRLARKAAGNRVAFTGNCLTERTPQVNWS